MSKDHETIFAAVEEAFSWKSPTVLRTEVTKPTKKQKL
jgi:hypothetical protein